MNRDYLYYSVRSTENHAHPHDPWSVTVSFLLSSSFGCLYSLLQINDCPYGGIYKSAKFHQHKNPV